jgi:diaminopimelate decarboxylase
MYSLPVQLLEEIAQKIGTPLYVYDLEHIRQRAVALRDAFRGHFRISYAVKANPNPTLLQRMRSIADHLDVSSGGELQRAIEAGWHPSQIGFTGPGKRDTELRLAVEHKIDHVIVESINEARRVNEIAERAGVIQPMLIRVSPTRPPIGFGARMAGKPTQFGIDEEVIDEAIDAIQPLSNARLDGFHVYSGTQCLDADAIVEHFNMTFSLFSDFCLRHDITPRALVIGSGFGIPYHEQDVALDLNKLGSRICGRVEQFKKDSRFHDTVLLLELGRFLVGESGCFLTRVISTKLSRGVPISICDGGMNQHLAAAGHLGSVIHRNYPIFKVATDIPATTTWQSQLIYGPLCTSIDLLGNQVKLPPLKPGDLIGIACSGAYGLTSSPIHFISHSPAAEILIEGVGEKRQYTDVSVF